MRMLRCQMEKNAQERVTGMTYGGGGKRWVKQHTRKCPRKQPLDDASIPGLAFLHHSRTIRPVSPT